MNDKEDEDYMEQPLDPQLVKAFENLWDHAVNREEYTSFLTSMEKKGHKREDTNWDFIRWVVLVEQHLIQEKDAEIEVLSGEVQIMDSDLAEARKELEDSQKEVEEQQSITRAVIARSRHVSPALEQPTGKATSKKFPDPSIWKSGTLSEWK